MLYVSSFVTVQIATRVGWLNMLTVSLQRGQASFTSVLDMTLNTLVLELWGMWSVPSLSLLSRLL